MQPSGCEPSSSVSILVFIAAALAATGPISWITMPPSAELLLHWLVVLLLKRIRPRFTLSDTASWSMVCFATICMISMRFCVIVPPLFSQLM